MKIKCKCGCGVHNHTLADWLCHFERGNFFHAIRLFLLTEINFVKDKK